MPPMSAAHLGSIRRRNRGILTLACTLALVGANPAALSEQVDEQALRAAFIFNFMLLTRWPESAAATDRALRLCYSQSSALRQALQPLRTRQIMDRTVELIPLIPDSPRLPCHVLLVEPDAKPPVIVPQPRIPGQLTISADSTAGAMITLVRDGDHVRFDVDSAATRAGNVELSSRLLQLARTIR